MIFVDTGPWYSAVVPQDHDHVSAVALFAGNRRRLVTTDYIVDELLTLFASRGQKTLGVRWLQNVLRRNSARLVRIAEADFEAAASLYERFQDKAWSFTDCTSYVVMQRLGITQAFSFDQHFRQFGFVTVLPAANDD